MSVTMQKHQPIRLVLKTGAALLCATMALHGGDAAALGLKQAYELAMKNDPTYQSAYFDNEAGKEYAVLGRSNLLPSVSYNYSNSQNRADLKSPDFFGNPALTHPHYLSKSSMVSLRQPLLNLDGLARYKEGVTQTKYSAAQFTGRGQEMLLRVIGAYVDVLYGDEQLAYAQAQRDTLVEQKRVNDRSFERGEGTRTDMLETQARLDVAEATVLEAIDNRTAARDTLASLIGQDAGALDPLSPDFHVTPAQLGKFDEWKALTLTHNTDIVSQTLSVESARQEIARNRAGHVPRIDLVANYGRSTADTVNTYQQESTSRSIGVQLSVPLYAGGATSASTRQAVANYEKAKADLQVKTDKAVLDLRKQYELVISSAAKVDALTKAVQSGQLLVTATEQSIKGGVRINLDLLNAQQQLTQTKRDLAQARYNYLLGYLRIRMDAGTIGTEDVTQVAAYFR